MNFIDIFAGIGGFRLGLEQAGHTCIGYVEKDKFAQKSYRAMHGHTGGFWAEDINNVDAQTIPKADIWTFGFPCQDISIAGDMEGLLKGNRSNLFFVVTGLLDEMYDGYKPTYLLIENVKNLLSINKGKDFELVLQELRRIGYKPAWAVLNSADYGVPQNRERVFIVAIKEDREVPPFMFPEPKPDYSTRVRDILEDNIPEKYYLSDRELIYMDRATRDGRTHWDFYHHTDITDKTSKCLTANMYKGVPYNVLRVASVDIKGNDISKRVYSDIGLAPTLTTGESGNTIPKIIDGKVARKFTPRECWRLQGFEDDYFDRAREVNSDTQLYKQAGNAVCVNVAYAIAKNLKEVV